MIDAGVVFNKGTDFSGDTGTNVVNDPKLHALCEKDRTYELFPQFCPRSFIVSSEADYAAALKAIRSDPVVIKPTNGEGGAGIFIGPGAEARALRQSYPLVVQEFVDTSKGIPGLVSGRHDLRLAFVGGKFAYAMIRMPPPGGMLSNLALGGSYIIIKPEQVPREAMDMALAIDRELERFPSRIYSSDMGLNADGRSMLFELNSPPGLRPARGNPIIERYHRMLAETLLNAAG
jgi:glutathione synthase/RimK-type ligase-like ATP-grasp enzyme